MVKGADWLISGASAISLRLNVKPIFIGLTVVAFGTSAPELMVSVTSLLSGNSGVALGNILGSNIANILLILGIASVIYPLHVSRNTILREVPMSLLGVVVFIVLSLQEFINSNIDINISTILFENRLVGYVTRADGLILLLFFSIFIYYTIAIARGVANSDEQIEKKPLLASVLLIIVGLIGLALGGRITVDSAIDIARVFGVSDNLIGLTIVAIGTSLPELATSVVAVLKKKVDIVIGSVIGSNIFNILFVLGISSLIKPIPFYTHNVFDAFVVFGVTILLLLILFVYKRHRISKTAGIIFLLLYLLYLGFIITRG